MTDLPDAGPMSAHAQRVDNLHAVLDMTARDYEIAGVSVGLNPTAPPDVSDVIAELQRLVDVGTDESAMLFVQQLAQATDDELAFLARVSRELREDKA